jgi:hypothetical protein
MSNKDVWGKDFNPEPTNETLTTQFNTTLADCG